MKHTNQPNYVAAGIAIGTAIGAVIGLDMGNPDIGISVGITLGAFIGYIKQKKQESFLTHRQLYKSIIEPRVT